MFAALNSNANPRLKTLPPLLGKAGCSEIALLIDAYLRVGDEKRFRADRRDVGTRASANLSRAAKSLRTAAKNYRAAQAIAPEIGGVMGGDAPGSFPELLEAEADRLSRQGQKSWVFRNKRHGQHLNHGYLIQLQKFVWHWTNGERDLSVTEIADFVQAGKAALDFPKTDADSPEAIEKSLRRFRSNDHNMEAKVCESAELWAFNRCRELLRASVR
jgi:hypothetical protein